MPNDEKTVNQRLEAIENGQAEIRADVAEVRADVSKLEAGQQRLESRVSNLEAGQQKLEAGQEELRAGQQKLEAGQQKLEAGQQKLEAGQEELRAGQDELRAGHERHETIQKQLQDGQARLEREMAAMRNDIAPLKAAHARSSALRVSYRICEDLGLDEVKILDRDELRAMVRQAVDIPRNHRYSFIEADAIIEAVNDAGETQYVALEASFTADERDTSRAIRNAGYLTRFTGRPAHAVIAAHRIDNRIAGIIDDGKVSWCHLDENDFEID